MPITIPSLDTVVSDARAFFRNRFPGRDDHAESFLGKLSRALAGIVSGLHSSVLAADNDATPSSASSDAAIDEWAETFGVPADNDGNYGRKKPTVATGGVGLLTGTNGTTFNAGTVAVAPDGVTLFALQGTVSIPGIPPGTGTVAGEFNATTAGTAGNLDVDTVLTWQSPPSGADSTFALTTATRGAVDSETTASLLERIRERLQQPPKGGAAVDWRGWAESVEGVDRAYAYPQRGGLGTVHTVITQAGTGTSRKPGAALQTAVDEYITGSSTEPGVRPVTVEGYTTLVPFMSVAQGLALRLRLSPSLARYAFDWARGTSAFTVASYSTGVITTNETPLAGLTAAVDAYLNGTGLAPRLQVMSTGSVVNEPVRVINYNSVAKTLTLESPLPTDWVPPTAADVIYSYGPIVETVAADVLAYVDSLGPSRQGGYADELDSWEDECALARLTQVALTAADADGTRFARDIITGGVTINGGTSDITAADGANGPEMLYALNIAVTD